MSAQDLDRVFGRSRLRMVTGAHVEVFREEAAPGERRRYTKRFLATPDGDFRLWTEREWRILARLVGHGVTHVPDVVQFDRGAPGRPALVQTYDAGVTVDHWATLLPVARDGVAQAHVFEDCAHWWALARAALVALDAIHALDVVHLDLKADNVCIPYAPSDADPFVTPHLALAPRFEQLALIDFAFSLVSGEPLVQALPIARQPDYPYQSPRLLHALEAGARGDLGPTQRLDWRCDLYSLAAMLRRHLPDPERAFEADWTPARHAQGRALVRELIAAHDAALAPERPHRRWIDHATRVLQEPALAASVARGWTLAWTPEFAADASPTPITRIARPVARDARSSVQEALAVPAHVATPWPAVPIAVEPDERAPVPPRARRRPFVVAAVAAAVAVAVAAPLLQQALRASSAPTTVIARDTRAAAPRVPPSLPALAASRAAAPSVVSPPASVEAAAASAPQTAFPPVVAMAQPPASSDQASPSRAGTAAAAPARIGAAPPSHTVPSVSTPAAASSKIVVADSAPAREPAAAKPRAIDALRERPDGALRARPDGALRPRSARQPLVASRAAPVGRHVAASARRPGSPLARGKSPTLVARVATSKGPNRRLIASTAGPRSSPAAGDGALRPALPPRVLAMLAATELPPPAAASHEPSMDTPRGPAAAPAPVPFPATPPAAEQAAVQRAAFEAVDYAARAHEVLASHVPRVAQRAERLAARALFMADHADDASQIAEVRRAADGVRLAPQDPLVAWPVASGEARALGDASRATSARRGAFAEAIAYQTRAFGANPLDAGVAGQLASLQLQLRPAEARTLALHALAVHDASHPGGRFEDWTTLAIANALVGRERDARAAWIVSLAVSPNAERACRAATGAYLAWGERLRDAVEALVYRAHQWYPAEHSPDCEWPPRRMASLVPR